METIKSSNGIGMVSKKRKILHEDDKLIDFLIIGAQKAGTMALVKNLNKHPDISILPHECHFFDVHWDKGVNWYKNKFVEANCYKKAIVGEKTPELIYVDVCAPRIKSTCPDAKFILCLRDPVKRAYSSWNMESARFLETLPFDECVSRELDSMMGESRTYGTSQYHYLQRGMYFDQIQRFLKVFPDRNQLLVVVAERLREDPRAEYCKIFQFLGAKEDFEFEAEDEHVGRYSDPIPRRLEERLRKLFAPHNERLFKWLGYRIPEWDKVEPRLISLEPSSGQARQTPPPGNNTGHEEEASAERNS